METKQQEDKTQELMAILKTARPYILEIEQEIAIVKNGEINLTLRVYNSKVTDLVMTRVTRKTYK